MFQRLDAKPPNPLAAPPAAVTSTTPADALQALLAALSSTAQVSPETLRRLINEELDKRPPARLTVVSPAGETTTEGTQHARFPLLLRLMASNSGHIFLSGPPGSGKTHAAEAAATALKREFFVVPPVGDKFEVTGFRDAQGNFQDTAVHRWAKAAPGAVLLLDEVDGGFPQALLAMNAMMANGIGVFPHEQVRIPPEHLVIANGNTWGGGADFDFTGRCKLDAAFLNRFPNKLVWDYDENLEASIAGSRPFASYIQAIRARAREKQIKLIITPRDTRAYAFKRAAGLSHNEALETGFMATVPPETREKLLAGLSVP